MNTIYYKTDEDIEWIRLSCSLVSKAIAEVAKVLKPGVTGLSIDRTAEEFIRDHGGVPIFKGYKGFPATLCVSPNEVVVHGIPNDKPFKEGDIVSIDCGVLLNGFVGDCAYTFAVGEIPESVEQLMNVTRQSLYKGIDQARSGNRIGDIGFAIQDFCERQHRYGVVRELVGHGVGKQLHEAPEVPNFGKKASGPKIREGLVIAIEPMVNLGLKEIVQSKDGWTIQTKDRKPSAHYEHTVVVHEDKTEILTTHEFIEEAIKNNDSISKMFQKK